MDDIAVIGVGLRFPGDATSPEELWEVLERGESQWSEFPKDRLNIDGYFHPSGDRQGSISFKGAHFLKGNVATFDAPFFSVSADDAKAIDPQQRILLEASYEALENAGLRKEDIDGSDTAVYVGSFVKDYEQICLRDPDWQPQYAATGNGIAIMANRISYAFNFHGPSMTIDTGCSGSLVSVHLAAQSLRNGESSLAIAAGAGMILTPNTIMPMTALNFLSPDGKCFTFDARANGYGRGEGIGVVVLKRLSDAIRDNDTIRAVIRGSRVNQDGRTTGITLPSKEAQVANIRSVYESSGLDFAQTGYVECHGTGTQAGDWRELKAISETLGSARDIDNPIVVGSVKPNIGHLEGAAGVAGLIKGVLVLERGKIPPNINFERGNPDIDFEDWRVKVPQSVMDWPLSGTRRVSINCFGFGGTNAHIIMDEAPAYLTSRGMAGYHNSLDTTATITEGATPTTTADTPHLFCFSSNEKAGVQRVIDSHIKHLESIQASAPADFLESFSYTLGCRRSNMEWKGAIIAKSIEELIASMKSTDKGSFTRSSKDKPPQVCFVFSGQGSQWAGMGKDLIGFKVFRESLEAASRFMKIYLRSSFELLQEMFETDSNSRISAPEISQPATTALQVALVDLLSAFGILPNHVIGHSSGEIAAAYASGAISRETAWEIAYYRGVVAASISVKAPKLKGGMIAVGMSPEEAEEYVESIRQSIQVACINSPRSVTLSGHADAISFIADDLSQKGVFHRVLPVKTAYHSKHMKLVEHDYKNHLAHMKPTSHTRKVTMFSSVRGVAVDGAELGPSYWTSNMVSPVRYVDAVQAMMEQPIAERPGIIIELGPRDTLQTPTSDILADTSSASLPALFSVLNRKADGATSLLQTLGRLWARGCPVEMRYAVTRDDGQKPPKCLVDLPPYPWNHSKTYWHESHLGEANRFRKYPRQDLIGAPTADSIPFEPRWRGFLRVSENPWIQDHQVQKTIVYPAAGMVSMVLEAAKQMSDGVDGLLGYEISKMKVEKAMIVPSTAHGLEMALNIKGDAEKPSYGQSSRSYDFAIYSKQLGGPWERNTTGFLRFRYEDSNSETLFHAARESYRALSDTCTESLVPRQLYELLDTVGMNYGSLFQNIVDIRKSENSCVSRIRIPDTKSKMPGQFEYPHVLHPATLDSMFQTLFAVEPVPMVPTFIESLFVSANLGEAGSADHFTGCSTAHRSGVADANADITMQLGDAQSYVMVKGLHLTGLMGSTPEDGGFLPNHRNLCTEIVWNQDATFAKPERLVEYVQLWAHKHPGLSILQVGGTCSQVLAVLDCLAPAKGETSRLFRYTIADIDGSSTAEALEHVAGTTVAPRVEKIKIDGSEALPEYDLILLHDESSVEASHLKKHLKSGGCMLRGSTPEPLGSTEPTWQSHGILPQPQGSNLEAILLHADECNLDVHAFMVQLMGLSAAQGCASIDMTTMPLSDVVREPPALAGKVVISLLDVGGSHKDGGFLFEWGQKDFDAFHVIQAMAKGIVWLTKGAHMESHNPKSSPMIALARTLVSEDSLKNIVTLDLDIKSRVDTEETATAIISVFLKTFVDGSSAGPKELEYAEKDGMLYIPRLVTVGPLNNLIEDGAEDRIAEASFCNGHVKEYEDTGLKLVIAKPGLMGRGMYFTEFECGTLGPQEVRIAFERSSLTFQDFEIALGRTTEPTVGSDVTGTIVRAGEQANGLEVGARVTALVVGGSLQNPVMADARFVTAARSGFVPSYFVSAYYAIFYIGRARPGRKVLVHAGASPHGLAAIQLCRIAGAEVFATVLGKATAEQRESLEKAGFPGDRIIDASSGNFVDVVMARTAGRGMDVVYNPTPEHLELNATCVRPCGAIVQLAAKSTSHRVSTNLASGIFAVFDLAQLMREDADFVAELFDSTLNLIQDQPLDFVLAARANEEFEIGKLEDAFRHIEAAPYLNHPAIVGSNEASFVVPVLRKDVTKSLRSTVDPTGTYLLAGGLGGLGRSISELLIDNGAKNLAFLSRSGASSDQAKAFLHGLKERGVTARAYCVDICDKNALRETIEGTISKELPPIRGVFQCAAVIKDAVFDNMTYADWMVAARPKMVGSWNLVDSIASAGQNPFFVFLASSAGVIGNRGQANYAAGNCFEDALARHLRLQGKHAVSIDLGPVLGAGMLAEDESILDMLRASGFYGIRHQDFLKVVKHAITMETLPGMPMPAQVTLGVGTGGLMLQNQPADPYWSRTALYSYLNLVDMPPPDLSLGSGSAKQDMKAMLASCADTTTAADIVCTGLMHMLAKAMNMLFEEMDAGKPPNSYGVDSLVAVGVRNWVLSNCGVQVSVFEVLSDKTIGELAVLIAEKGGLGANKG